MRKTGLILLCFLAAQNYAFSQSKAISSFFKASNISLGLTMNNWMEVPDSVEVKFARNRGVDIAVLHRFGRGAFGFSAGLGISNVNIHTNVNPFGFDSATGKFEKTAYRDMTEIKKNKLSLTYLEVPLEVGFKLKPKSDTAKSGGFKMAVGFRAGYCIDAHTKLKKSDGEILKDKDFDGINRWRYGVTARIGYGVFSVYGRYDLSSTFDSPNAPDFRVYSAGIVFSGF